MAGNGNLTLDQRKWICREFWKTQNIEEVRRVWFIDFNTPPPSRFTIRRIKDKSFINAYTHTLTKVNSFSFFF